MASNINLLIVILVLVSFSLTFGDSLSTRDVVSKQEDESYVMTTHDQISSMIVVVEDIVKERSLHELVANSKAVVSKKSSSSKKSKSKSKKKKKGKKSIKPGAIAGIVILVVLVIILICYIVFLYKRKKAKSIEKAKKTTDVSPENKTSKTEENV